MTFKYFKASPEEMFDLVGGNNLCLICYCVHDYCFDLEIAITDLFSNDNKMGKVGCYDCLKKGKFKFWHDTEFGMVDDKGLRKVYSHNMDNPPKIDEEILEELRRTPQFGHNQQELWLTHCNDFMIYAGIWEPLDFYTNSKTGDGRDLFMDMTNKEINHIWDFSLEKGEKILEEWNVAYYVFECRHCGKLRGYWDCD